MGEIKSGATDTIRITCSEKVMTGYVLKEPVIGEPIVWFKKRSDPTHNGMLVTESCQLMTTDIQSLDTHVWCVRCAENNCTYILQRMDADISGANVIIGNIFEQPREGKTIKVIVWKSAPYGMRSDSLLVQAQQVSVLSEEVFNIVSDEGTQYIVETL